MIEAAENLQTLCPWFWPLAVFIFGACVGSFLNVCVYRIPAGKSIVRPGSACACGKPIAWYDNIPILSWFLLRGKARCCKAPFSIRYPLIEALTGCVFTAVFLLYPFPQAAPLWLFLALLIVGAFIDLDTMELPDIITVGGTVIGVILAFAIPQLHAQTYDAPWLFNSLRSGAIAILGAIVGSGVIVWIREIGHLVFRREAMGLGDVVLMGCIGAFCGWQGALFAIFGGSVFGAALMIPWVLFSRLRARQKDTPPADTAIPFGPWLALGAAVYILGARAGVDTYFANIQSLLFP